jgi:hypothetical protein
MIADRLLSRLDGVRRVGHNGWIARCPAHDDRNPSLSITENEDKLLVHCKAECPTEEVLAAVGLMMSDLFERTGDSYAGRQRRASFNARSVLAVLSQDATHIYMAGAHVARGQMLSAPDKAALLAAVQRVRYAAILAGAI